MRAVLTALLPFQDHGETCGPIGNARQSLRLSFPDIQERFADVASF